MLYLDLIELLGFKPKENTLNILYKKYADGYVLEIDFSAKKINYGDLIQSESKTTQNFSQAENWVVLECVNRLLEKGYKPQNIILEKTWDTGHGTSGRLDILVTREDGTAYLMIECKTYGAEFDKEFNKLKKDGGQLFTYFQQDTKADLLMLYASDLQNNAIVYRNEIIKIEEDYRQAGNVQDFYDRWNKLPKNNGVFDAWVSLYGFQNKALTKKDLHEIKQEDSGFIFNQFLEILRHNVVSDKPNAFNKIFTLFLCKICDEKSTNKNDELKFQWLEGQDDHISFQKRLTDLYKKGMKEFLEKEVTDLSDEEFENKFHSVDESIKKQFLEQLTEIRLKKNNEFSIKEVFDDDSFNENAKVVKEVVELLQNFKIRYTRKHSYLSDFFELLLTTGLKQESGQFFTPVPIAQFIIKSLPIDHIVKTKLEKGETNQLLPTVIDYAAGSGHFITESMHEIQRLIDSIDPNNFIETTARKLKTWREDHFDWAYQYVYGIEKDYRLVKVGKVGCYLHGDGLAKIVHSDGLGSFSKTKEYKELLLKTDKDFPRENKQFDIVVSNPPYSVSKFKLNARKYYTENDFDIYDNLTDQSSEIECLFIERAKQLLKDGGVTGIILPSSILSNGGIYTKAREIILQYFDIVAIAELGSNTFMATGTNTVTLFLRRRSNYLSINLKGDLKKAVDDAKDVTLNGIEKPISKYVAHVWEGISFDDYASLLKKSPTETIQQHDLYREYIKKFGDNNFNKIIELETEKLFYFILAYKQKVVLVKSGEKQIEKQFLGYEFSNRRSSEGIHPMQRGKTIEDCTQLFDKEIFDNPEKASTYIYQAFKGDFNSPIHDKLSSHIFRVDLVDLFTFDRVEFDKSLFLSVKKKLNIESKWELVKLGEICEMSSGGTPLSKTPEYYNGGNILWINSGEVRQGVIFDSVNKITELGLKNSSAKIFPKNTVLLAMYGATTGQVGILGVEASTNQAVCGILPNDKILPFYLFNFLKTQYATILDLRAGVARLNISQEIIKNMKVPLPPKDIQEKIVAEIEVLEVKEIEAKEGLERLKNEITKIVDSVVISNQWDRVRLGDICEILSGGTPDTKNQDYWDGDINWATLVDTKKKYLFNTVKKITLEGIKKSSAVILPVNTVMFSSRATIGDVCINKVETCTNQGYKNFVCNKEKIHYEFLYYVLKNQAKNIAALASGMTYLEISKSQISGVKISLPPLEKQQEIITQITAIETQIAVLEKELENLPQQKEAILAKYL